MYNILVMASAPQCRTLPIGLGLRLTLTNPGQKREIKELAKVSAEHVEIIANLRDQINALIEKLQVKPKKGCK